jgi:phosphate transport system ATP-binding protein
MSDATASPAPAGPARIEFDDYSLSLNSDSVLRNVSLGIPSNAITAVFGPAGGGKSGLLRSINRMAELAGREHHSGDLRIDGVSVFAPGADLPALRRRVGMVFAQPVPLPMSIFDNVTYGLRLQKIDDRLALNAATQRALEQATLWDEVKDRLHSSALALSGGQQQRLSIARVLALEPEILLLDAPTAALDPISTHRIEDMLMQLKRSYTIVIVPHSIQQASRIADVAAFFLGGELVEFGPRDRIFISPQDERTENYVTGRFG